MNNYSNLCDKFETIADFLRFAITQANQNKLYFGHGTDNVEDDMWLLVGGILHLSWETKPWLLNAKLTAPEKELLVKALYNRIINKIPVPYITNKAYFCDLCFYVDERVLIPRSPIAELIKNQFSPWLEKPPHRILDLCTGSGCIAIACSYAFPEASIDASDISPDALAVATMNCHNHHLANINLITSDCWENIPAVKYDLIIANPPYVSRQEFNTLPAEYQHEPKIALEASKQGLAIVEKILKRAHKYLSEYGIVVVEVGNSTYALEKAFPKISFTWLDFEHGGEGVFVLTKQQLQAYFA